MPDRRFALIAAGLALASLLFTLCVWLWILSQPEGTFHDQGGLRITLVYFPATFLVWILFGLPSILLLRRKARDGAGADSASIPALRRIVFGLIALGLLMSITTLFIA